MVLYISDSFILFQHFTILQFPLSRLFDIGVMDFLLEAPFGVFFNQRLRLVEDIFSAVVVKDELFFIQNGHLIFVVQNHGDSGLVDLFYRLLGVSFSLLLFKLFDVVFHFVFLFFGSTILTVVLPERSDLLDLASLIHIDCPSALDLLLLLRRHSRT